MKKLFFFLVFVMFTATIFAMEERPSLEVSFLRPHSTQKDAQKLIEICREYLKQIKEIINGRLNLATIEKNNALDSDALTQRNAQLNYERIERLSFDITIAPQKAYPFIHESALAFRNIPAQYKTYFSDAAASRMKQDYWNSKVFDEDYLAKQNNFRLALDYQSNKIFEQIAKKWYSYIVSNELQEALPALYEKIVNDNMFSKGFREKINGFYNQLQMLQTTAHQEPLAIVEILEKVQCMKSSMRHFMTVMHLNDSEQQALNTTLALFHTLDIDYDNLMKILS
jgi:hypothetical protein